MRPASTNWSEKESWKGEREGQQEVLLGSAGSMFSVPQEVWFHGMFGKNATGWLLRQETRAYTQQECLCLREIRHRSLKSAGIGIGYHTGHAPSPSGTRKEGPHT